MLYEYPLHEKIRTLLRLEHLFARLDDLVMRESVIDHHYALMTMFELMDVGARSDLKSDIYKDLERNKSNLHALRGNPDVDESSLQGYLQVIDSCLQKLAVLPGKFGGSLNENEWLMSIKSRSSIPGGTCTFDLPSYYAWQCHSGNRRQQELFAWQRHFEVLSQAVSLLLSLVRSQSSTLTVTTHVGQFQQSIAAGKTYQLLQVEIEEHLNLIPEISANRLLVMIRLMRMGNDGRLKASPDEVPLKLTFCA